MLLIRCYGQGNIFRFGYRYQFFIGFAVVHHHHAGKLFYLRVGGFCFQPVCLQLLQPGRHWPALVANSASIFVNRNARAEPSVVLSLTAFKLSAVSLLSLAALLQAWNDNAASSYHCH
jgi:hypothetical protein